MRQLVSDGLFVVSSGSGEKRPFIVTIPRRDVATVTQGFHNSCIPSIPPFKISRILMNCEMGIDSGTMANLHRESLL